MALCRRLVCLVFWTMVVGGLGSTLSAQSAVGCAGTANNPLVRADDYTAQTSDIFIQCVGGTATPSGSPVPAMTITVFMNTTITSKITASGFDPAFNEALLLIDEPGTSSTNNPILNCGNVTGGAPYDSMAGTGVCQIVSDGVSADTYNGSAGHPNVFQARQVTGSNGTEIQFIGVPYDGGVYRAMRITNLRASAGALTGGFVGSSKPTFQAVVTFTPPGSTEQILNVVNGVTWNSIGSVTGGTVATYPQCSAGGSKSGGSVTITEGFPAAWKARNWKQIQDNGQYVSFNWQYSNTLNWTATDLIQNVASALYNTETGLFYPPATDAPSPDNPPQGTGGSTSTPVGNQAFVSDDGSGIETAGGVNSGTRVALLFSSIPTGSNATVPSVIPLLNSSLVQTGVMIAVTGADANGAGGTPLTTGASIPLSDTGSTTVIYEVLFSSPSAIETATVPVTINPTSTVQPGVTAQVQVSDAPFYVNTISVPAGSAQVLYPASGGFPIPRFVGSFGVAAPVDLFSFTDCAVLAGSITAKSGSVPARDWTVTVTNIGQLTATAAQITGLALMQTFGPSCTPSVTTTFPVAVGDIAPSMSASGDVIIDFRGCSNNARFKAAITYSSDGGSVTGSKTLYNQFR